VLMERRNGLGVIGAETTQRHDPSVEQSSRSRELHRWIAHYARRYRGPAGLARGH